jgi:hypothetical protein
MIKTMANLFIIYQEGRLHDRWGEIIYNFIKILCLCFINTCLHSRQYVAKFKIDSPFISKSLSGLEAVMDSSSWDYYYGNLSYSSQILAKPIPADCQLHSAMQDASQDTTTSIKNRFHCIYVDCNKSYSVKNSLLNHYVDIHLKLQILHCELCEFSCNRTDQLDQHRAKHFNLKLQCNDCGKVYKTKKTYRDHSCKRKF